MDTKREKYDMLIEQRKQIFSQIQLNNKSFHTAIFSILTLYTASYFITEVAEKPLTLITVFVISQVSFIIICYVMGLLLAMNNDRDLIRAIDMYIEEYYGIDTLFWQGELSYRHINKKSMFSKLTFVVAIIFVVLLVGILSFRLNEIIGLIKEYTIFAIILLVEVLSVIMIVARNLKYKITGTSQIMNDCYNFLKRNEMEDTFKLVNYK